MQLRLRHTPGALLRAPLVVGIGPVSQRAQRKGIGADPKKFHALMTHGHYRKNQQADQQQRFHRNVFEMPRPTALASRSFVWRDIIISALGFVVRRSATESGGQFRREPLARYGREPGRYRSSLRLDSRVSVSFSFQPHRIREPTHYIFGHMRRDNLQNIPVHIFSVCFILRPG